MKIRVIDRILLFLLGLILLVTCACLVLNEFGINAPGIVLSILDFELTGTTGLVVRIAAIVVLVFLCGYLLGLAFSHKKKPDPFINMESGNKGSIRMSMDSISSLVLQTCSRIPGLSGLKVATINHEDSVSVDMSFQVEMNRNIPELSAQIQEIVGDAVERNCGVAVRNVCVTVSGFTTPAMEHPALPPKPKKAEKRGWFHRDRAEEPILATSEPVEEESAAAAEPEETPATELSAPAETAETAEESAAAAPEEETTEPETQTAEPEPAAEPEETHNNAPAFEFEAAIPDEEAPQTEERE